MKKNIYLLVIILLFITACQQNEVIKTHSSVNYLVYAIGFSPGFPYLGGLPEKLNTPRLKNPRIKIPAGSVAIAETQTGIYPSATPGGWQIIGKTPLKLFDHNRNPPVLLNPGDKIKFEPINPQPPVINKFIYYIYASIYLYHID